MIVTRTQPDSKPARCIDMCVRCNSSEAPQPLGLCAACALHTRVELSDGLRRLEDYLDTWAEFNRWLDERTPG
jgi:hypothetical protein